MRTTLLSSPTQSPLSSASHHVLQMHHCCLAVAPTSNKLRFFTSPSPEQNTDHPTSPLAMSYCNQYSSLLTWAASSHLMQGSTTNCQRQLPYLVGCSSMLDQQMLEEQDTDSSLQHRGTSHFFVWLKYLGHMPQSHTFPGVLSSALSPYNSQHSLELLHHSVEIQEQAEIPNIEAMLFKYQLRWAGPVSRVEDHRLQKIALHCVLSTYHREIGARKNAKMTVSKSSSTLCWLDMSANRNA